MNFHAWGNVNVGTFDTAINDILPLMPRVCGFTRWLREASGWQCSGAELRTADAYHTAGAGYQSACWCQPAIYRIKPVQFLDAGAAVANRTARQCRSPAGDGFSASAKMSAEPIRPHRIAGAHDIRTMSRWRRLLMRMGIFILRCGKVILAINQQRGQRHS